MRLMSHLAVLAMSMMEGVGRFFAPDLGREHRHRGRSIPSASRLPRGHRYGDPVLAAKYQADRRARKALEWERQQKWRACIQPWRRGGTIPAAYARDLAMRFPAPA